MMNLKIKQASTPMQPTDYYIIYVLLYCIQQNCGLCLRPVHHDSNAYQTPINIHCKEIDRFSLTVVAFHSIP